MDSENNSQALSKVLNEYILSSYVVVLPFYMLRFVLWSVPRMIKCSICHLFKENEVL